MMICLFFLICCCNLYNLIFSHSGGTVADNAILWPLKLSLNALHCLLETLFLQLLEIGSKFTLGFIEICQMRHIVQSVGVLMKTPALTFGWKEFKVVWEKINAKYFQSVFHPNSCVGPIIPPENSLSQKSLSSFPFCCCAYITCRHWLSTSRVTLADYFLSSNDSDSLPTLLKCFIRFMCQFGSGCKEKADTGSLPRFFVTTCAFFLMHYEFNKFFRWTPLQGILWFIFIFK